MQPELSHEENRRRDDSSSAPSSSDVATDPSATYQTRPTQVDSTSQSPTHPALLSKNSPGYQTRARPGDNVNHFNLVSLIAQGGMGEVWEANDLKLHRSIALKLIRPDNLTPDLIRRFETESLAQACLHHDGIAQIFQAETAVTQPFIAMELIRGARRLNVYARDADLNVSERVELLIRVVDAIGHAHQQRVLHLDLKPSNILVRADGQPKVLDFGGGRILDAPLDPGRDVAIVTPAYMSPEQTRLDLSILDHRSDLYSLGVVAFELFEGALPYSVSGLSFPQVRDEICGPTPPRQLRALRGAVRREVGAVVLKALQKQPADRYQSAEDFSRDLRALVGGTDASAGWRVSFQRWLRRPEHVPWAGQALSLAAWLIVALCFWFIIVAIAMPGLRAVVIPDVRMPLFVVHEGVWVLALGVLGYCARGAGRGRAPLVWLMCAFALGLNVFTLAVASGMYDYDGAGSVTDPHTRAIVFTVLSGIAAVSLLLCALMVASFYARAPWITRPGQPGA